MKMRNLVVCAWALVGCAQPQTEQLAVAAVPPPMVLSTVELYAGGPGQLTVTGADPGDTVFFVASQASGAGPCPAALGGACLGLQPTIRRLGRATATSAGEATLQPTLPAGLLNQLVYVQAVVADGRQSYLSSVGAGIVLDAACVDVVDDFWAEAGAIRACSRPSDCGQVLSGTSCGCTRNWVANNSADTTLFYDLLGDAATCGVLLASTCDCPPTSGFDCVAGQCTWNYTVP